MRRLWGSLGPALILVEKRQSIRAQRNSIGKAFGLLMKTESDPTGVERLHLERSGGEGRKIVAHAGLSSRAG